VDEYHGLARLSAGGASSVNVRMHPDDCWDNVAV
jgi:hypothetical protein